jgi:hypothetical protein
MYDFFIIVLFAAAIGLGINELENINDTFKQILECLKKGCS